MLLTLDSNKRFNAESAIVVIKSNKSHSVSFTVRIVPELMCLLSNPWKVTFKIRLSAILLEAYFTPVTGVLIGII